MRNGRLNPFASKLIRAGELEFRFPNVSLETGLQRLKQNLEQNHWRGQVVGPHGSGKTTLLRMLDERWSAWDRTPFEIVLRHGQRRLPASFWKDIRRQNFNQIVVDGFEQLDVICKLMLWMRCVMWRRGLLITTHHTVLFWPIIHRTQTSESLVSNLVAELLQNQETLAGELTNEQKAELENRATQLLAQHRGNIRETLFAMYDEVARSVPQ